jgi:hypothetical protein
MRIENSRAIETGRVVAAINKEAPSNGNIPTRPRRQKPHRHRYGLDIAAKPNDPLHKVMEFTL